MRTLLLFLLSAVLPLHAQEDEGTFPPSHDGWMVGVGLFATYSPLASADLDQFYAEQSFADYEDYRCYRFLHFYHGQESPDVLLSPAACSPADVVDTLVIDRGYGEEGDVLVVLTWTPSDVSGENVPMVAHAWLRAAGVSGLVWDDVYGIGRRILQELPEGARASHSNYLALTLFGEPRTARGVMMRREDGEVMFHLCEEYEDR